MECRLYGFWILCYTFIFKRYIFWADDHRILVEPACGASVAAIYGGVIQRLQSEGKLPAKMESGIVVIVCGGISITQNMLADWKNDFQLEWFLRNCTRRIQVVLLRQLPLCANILDAVKAGSVVTWIVRLLLQLAKVAWWRGNFTETFCSSITASSNRRSAVALVFSFRQFRSRAAFQTIFVRQQLTALLLYHILSTCAEPHRWTSQLLHLLLSSLRTILVCIRCFTEKLALKMHLFRLVKVNSA